MIGRFAPSPTGPLHVGNAFTAFVAWRRAQEFVMRVEDLDTPRVLPGCEAQQLDDLRWLGLHWTQGPFRQSERLPLYAAAVERLVASGHAYYCTCSRKQIALASAPHGAEGPRYPGTCRGRTTKPDAQYSVRFLVDAAPVTFTDGAFAEQTQNVDDYCGDFVIARADGVFAYQLAVVVDDIAMQIGEVVRGADLLASTPRQILLYRALGKTPPAFFHVPLVTAGGQKLSKRNPRHTLQGLRALCVKPETLRERFAEMIALRSGEETVDVGEF